MFAMGVRAVGAVRAFRNVGVKIARTLLSEVREK